MACNCGKRKPRPQPRQNAAKQPSEAEQVRAAQQAAQQAGQNGKQAFTLQTRSGRIMSFGSKLEADAANARTGFTGTVSPA